MVWDFFFRPVVPNLLGTTNWFLGRYFSHGPGVGAGNGFGMIQVLSIYCTLSFWSNVTADLTRGTAPQPKGWGSPDLNKGKDKRRERRRWTAKQKQHCLGNVWPKLKVPTHMSLELQKDRKEGDKTVIWKNNVQKCYNFVKENFTNWRSSINSNQDKYKEYDNSIYDRYDLHLKTQVDWK